MTVDELAEKLGEARTAANADLPVRLVVKAGRLGRQYDCIDAQLHEGLHGGIVLVFAGEEAADMDWPSAAP
jgi:hypothetical protein